MSTDKINPKYNVTKENGVYGIFGTETLTGEHIEIRPFTRDEILAKNLVNTLNKEKVSLCHARDVIADEIIKDVIK